ncbi:aminotransferase class I/II-fold pyridoxal phosphate-dependent enzyme [Nonomuraea sp. NPDC049695]|uniref:aminotransferase class I/II-fold pyridoxal phosphate-dependent enzyme n=1 Tax=Nonomuraea sp. NPDC049695 TaxID=3154734 RepID=UPI003413582D
MIDFGGAQPVWPVKTRELWGCCAAEAARAHEPWRRQPPQGDDMLRAELGRELRLEPDHLTIVAGVRAAALTYGRTAARLLVERPTFMGMMPMLESAGRPVHHVGWDDLPAPQTGTTLIVTSPCRNPDGATLSPRLHAAMERRCDAGERVVINSTYQWFGPGTPPVRGADLLLSLHKLAGVGARIGVVHSSTFFADAVPEIASAAPPPTWQRAWALFLARGGLAELKAANVVPAQKAAAAFHASLCELTGSPRVRVQAPHTLLTLTADVTEQAALAALAARGYRLAGGSHFLAGESLRVSFYGVSPEQASELASTLVADKLLDLKGGS